MKKINNIVYILFIVAFTFSCAQFARVPGGTNTINESFFKTKEEFLQLVDNIEVGSSEQEVLEKLRRKKEDLIILTREEIVASLLGTNNIEVQNSLYDRDILYTLYGYKLNYKVVKRKHGFSSPIRIRTDEEGFNYRIILVFQKNKLIEKPMVTGGDVQSSTSKTFFDFLSPGSAINKAGF